MEFNKRKEVNDELKKYCYMAKENDYIAVTEWTNGEGIDVNIYSNGETKSVPLTYGELEAINYLRMTLDYQKEKFYNV